MPPPIEDLLYQNSSNLSMTVEQLVNATLNCSVHNETLPPYCIDPPLGDQIQQNFWFLLLLVFPVLTLFGNLLVVLSVMKERSLQNATNYFIVSLAIADISLAVLVMPLATWNEVNYQYWGYSEVFCDSFLMLDVMFCTSSILNLVAISLDRFVAVTSPLSYSRHNNSKRVYLTIVFTWLLSFAIALPILCGLNYTKNRNPQECTFSNSDFIIYSSLGSFYIPAIAMLFLYYRIFKMIRLRGKRAAQIRQGQTYANKNANVNNNINIDSKQNAKENDKRASEALLKSYTKVEANTDGTYETVFCNASTLEPPNSLHNKRVLPNGGSPNGNVYYDDAGCGPSTSSSSGHCPQSGSLEKFKQLDCQSTTAHNFQPIVILKDSSDCSAEQTVEFANMEEFRRHLKERIRRAKLGPKYKEKKKHQIVVRRDLLNWCGEGCANVRSQLIQYRQAKNAKKKPTNKEKSAAKQEKKATKTLAIVLGVFLICWLPFFTSNVIHSICIKLPKLQQSWLCMVPMSTISVWTWLGYINSFLNPIIYTIFNIEFRRAFKSLLHIK